MEIACDRRFRREAAPRTLVLDGDELAGVMPLLISNEASGWKGRMGTAIANDPDQTAFYRDFTRRVRERGWLEWHIHRTRGKAIACHMAVRIDCVLYLWKIAYDEAHKAYAPGNALMLNTIRRAFDSGVIEEVNCLTNSEWNRNWNMEGRRYYNVAVWPKRTLPFLAGYCRKKTKSVLRRVPLARQVYHAVRRVGP